MSGVAWPIHSELSCIGLKSLADIGLPCNNYCYRSFWQKSCFKVESKWLSRFSLMKHRHVNDCIHLRGSHWNCMEA